MDLFTRDPSIGVPKTKLGSVIAEAIRARIARGELAEGDTLPNEREMQIEYGISRSTLREALRTLEAENLITSPRGGTRGARVNLPSADAAARCADLVLHVRGATFGDIFAVRALVEPEAARLVAMRRPVPDLPALRTILERMREAADDPLMLNQLMAAFNETLLELSGNEALRLVGQILAKLILNNSDCTPGALEDYPPETPAAIARSHQALADLIDAIEAGDGGRAKAVHEEILSFVGRLHIAAPRHPARPIRPSSADRSPP